MTIVTPAPLVGQAIGDALGMPFETQSMFSSSLLIWDGSYGSSNFHKLGPGQWTDDTMMAKLVAESLVANRGFRPADVAQRYLQWYKSGDHRGMGKTTKEALAKLDRGVPWAASGIVASEGNGTAMRAIPIGCFFRNRPNLLAEACGKDAGITHLSLEAISGSLAIANAAAHLSMRRYSLAELPRVIMGQLPESSRIREKLQTLVDAIDRNQSVSDFLLANGTGAHVVQTVPAAIGALVLTTSFKDAVEASIRAGGDTDTTAAIAGGLAGIWYGREGIPTGYEEPIENVADLRSLDEALFA